MKIRLLISVLLSSLLLFSCNYKKEKKLKTQIEWEAEYLNGRIIKTDHKNFITKYDQEGKVIEEILLNSGNEIGYRNVYYYDSRKNNFAKLRYKRGNSFNLEYNFYDTNQQLSKTLVFFPSLRSKKIIYIREKCGCLKEVLRYDGDGEVSEKDVYFYEENQISKIFTYYNSFSHGIERTEYNYDAMGREKSYEVYDYNEVGEPTLSSDSRGSKSPAYIVEYFYDKEGKLEESTFKFITSGEKHYSAYTYEYYE